MNANIQAGWQQSLGEHARAHPMVVGGLLLAFTATVLMLAQSLFHAYTRESGQYLGYAFLGGLAGLAGTTVGALPALLFRSIPKKLKTCYCGAPQA